MLLLSLICLLFGLCPLCKRYPNGRWSLWTRCPESNAATSSLSVGYIVQGLGFTEHAQLQNQNYLPRFCPPILLSRTPSLVCLSFKFACSQGGLKIREFVDWQPKATNDTTISHSLLQLQSEFADWRERALSTRHKDKTNNCPGAGECIETPAVLDWLQVCRYLQVRMNTNDWKPMKPWACLHFRLALQPIQDAQHTTTSLIPLQS
jgi:hypothetical protein